jgi:Trypsin-like peptidase domain
MADEAPKALSTAEQLLHSTIRIECRDAKGSVSSGTGFNFSFEIDGIFVPVIVTNRHVFQNAVQSDFHYTMADSDGRSTGIHQGFSVSEFGKAWIGHPDLTVDLAILPTQPLFEHLSKHGKRPFYINLSQGIIASQEMLATLDAIEEITMIGYPNGIWDQVNNLPIVRRGITATPAARHYQGNRQFLIDAAVFPGSSGSPVFIFDNGSFSPSGGGIQLGTRLMLIGVVFGVHQHTLKGEIKLTPVPTVNVPIPVSQMPNNLGACIHASRILDFIPILQDRIATDAAKAAK